MPNPFGGKFQNSYYSLIIPAGRAEYAPHPAAANSGLVPLARWPQRTHQPWQYFMSHFHPTQHSGTVRHSSLPQFWTGQTVTLHHSPSRKSTRFCRVCNHTAVDWDANSERIVQISLSSETNTRVVHLQR